MKKQIFKLALIAIVTFAGINAAQAMVSCDDAEAGQECSLIAPEELESLEAEMAQDNSGQEDNSPTVLPSSKSSGDSMMLIVGKKATGNAITTLDVPSQNVKVAKAYQGPDAPVSSPLSQSGI